MILSSVRFGLRPSINATVVMMLGITLFVALATALALKMMGSRGRAVS